jgi:SanA protein
MEERIAKSGRLRAAWGRIGRKGRIALGVVVLGAAVPLLCDVVVGSSARVHTDAALVPKCRVALVLGTAPTIQGRPNLFYTYRLRAAADLWEAGAIDGVLVSGDNGNADYNEPDAMRADLVALGVPADVVTCDYAGFRTLDSVVRAKEVFGLERCIVVSQPTHAERAVYLAEAHGLDATAFGAREPGARRARAKSRLREVAARTLAVFDVLLGTEPKFLGPPVEVATRERGDR